MYNKATEIKIDAEGLSKPILLSGAMPMRYRVYVPEGTTAIFGVKYTMDSTDAITAGTAEWADDETIEPGTAESASGVYHAPVTAISVNVEMISGGPIYLKTLEPQG